MDDERQPKKIEKVKGCSCPDCRFQFPEAFDERGELKPGK